MKNKKHLEVPPLPTKASNSKCFGGFTLAETLIVLVVLGIVASLTIPPLVRRQIEAANRVKIKKAMGVYDTMMAKIAVENDLKSNAALQEWNTPDENGNYPVANYVKYTKYANDSKCQFCTSDGVCVDYCNIQTPIIALKEEYLNEESAKNSNNKAFYLYAQFDNQGILRVTDPQFTYTLTTGYDKTEVNKSVSRLYDFLNGEKSINNKDFSIWSNEFASAFNNTCTEESYANCTVRNDHERIVYNSKGDIIFEGDCDEGVGFYCNSFKIMNGDDVINIESTSSSWGSWIGLAENNDGETEIAYEIHNGIVKNGNGDVIMDCSQSCYTANQAFSLGNGAKIISEDYQTVLFTCPSNNCSDKNWLQTGKINYGDKIYTNNWSEEVCTCKKETCTGMDGCE